MLQVAARQWWVLILQGVLGIIVGVWAILDPGLAVTTLALLFGIWAIASGVAQLAAGWRVAEVRGRSWPFLVSGAVSAFAGVIAVVYPGITALYLVLLLGAWILVAGVMEVYTAWKIRDEVTNEGILALLGIARIVVGVIILAIPVVGVVITAALFATWALIGGVSALAFGWRLRSLSGGQMSTAGAM
jgi:uncharacterized membrane protein HdeD (DUF308 family)